MKKEILLASVLETTDAELLAVPTHAAGPAGKLELNTDLLLNAPSGQLFGLTQNAGMGWNPARLNGP